MEHILRMIFVAFVAVFGMLLNHDISTRAQTLHYLKEDLEIALHDAALQINANELGLGRIVFDQEKAIETFHESFQKNTGLSKDDYELVEIEFIDHSNTTSYPVEYKANLVNFSDVFTAPTVVAFVRTKQDAYFENAKEKEFIQVASYTYKTKIMPGEKLLSSFVIGEPNAQGFVWPAPHTRNVTSPLGERIHPITKERKFHAGIDIASAGIANTPAVAAKEGTVIYAGELGGYGNLVIISHGYGLETRYAHLSSIEVTKGEKVSTGQVIGRIGSTGSSTSDHLHFEIRVNGKPYDPLTFYE